MGNEWKTVRLGDHVDACLGKMLDKNKNQGTLHPYLGNKQVRWGSFDLDDLSEMKFQDHEHERYGLKFGDLVVCEGGEPGRCALWKGEVPVMKIQKALHRIRPYDELDSAFLHYWFCYAGKFELLDPYFTGTTIKHLTGKAIAELPIPLPPLPEQKAIAQILGSLDDKVELNRRMNETLEGISRNLFKSWFTDFDPVLDNAILAGNSIPDEFAQRAEVRRKVLAQNQPSPNLSQGERGFPDLGKTAADFPSIGNKSSNVRKHFPDSFQPSELGPIPTGWEASTFGDVASAIRNSVNPSSLDADVPYVGLEHIGRKQMYLSGWGYAGDVDSNKSAFQTGDVLFGKLRPYFHKVCIMNFAGVCSTDVLVFRAKEDCWKGFVQYQLFDEKFVEYANARSTGTRMPRASWKDMEAYSIAKPSDDIAAHFTELIEDFNAKAMLNVESSSKLARLRDTLLPKLISGGIGCLRNE